MFQNNKYYSWYINIITKAQQREKPDCYCEEHHIIPESLGGKNEPSNMVFLTAKEHFICHQLIVKCINEEHYYKMVWAIHRMTYSGNYKLTARQYESVRKLHSDNMRNNHPSKKIPNYTELHSKRIIQSYVDHPELIEKRSNAFKDYWKTDEGRKEGIKNNKKHALLGGTANALLSKGTKHPEWGKPGNQNSMAKLYIIVDHSTNNMYNVMSNEILMFCEMNNLSYSSFKRHGRTKTFEVLSSKFLRERRIGNE